MSDATIVAALARLDPRERAAVELALGQGHAAMLRIADMAEVPCVKQWKRQPMKCFPNDPCSFCRCRAFLETNAVDQGPMLVDRDIGALVVQARAAAMTNGDPLGLYNGLADACLEHNTARVTTQRALLLLVEEMSGRCVEYPACDLPARWGHDSFGRDVAYSCDQHRRAQDVKEVGSPALIAARELLRWKE